MSLLDPLANIETILWKEEFQKFLNKQVGENAVALSPVREHKVAPGYRVYEARVKVLESDLVFSITTRGPMQSKAPEILAEKISAYIEKVTQYDPYEMNLGIYL